MVKEYPINSKKYGKHIVLLDDEDYERLQKWGHKLQLRYDPTIKGYYVQFKVKPLGISKKNGKDMRKCIPLHRWITNCPKHLQVDHINHNTLDNRKCNLRKCTCRENSLNKRNNTSGYPGVRWHSQGKKWNARIVINGKEKSLGMFENFDDAVKARRKALKEVMPNVTL